MAVRGSTQCVFTYAYVHIHPDLCIDAPHHARWRDCALRVDNHNHVHNKHASYRALPCHDYITMQLMVCSTVSLGGWVALAQTKGILQGCQISL